MAAGALMLDEHGHILIVKPTYRPDWLIPGGVVEDDESPRAACQREVREEVGLDLPIGRLLCLEYQSSRAESTENLQFIFWGGVLSEAMVKAIVLPPGELESYRLAPLEEAVQLLAPRLARRIRPAAAALEQNRFVYMENGIEAL